MKKIPVYIVSGFLGAGKTSFLKNWILREKELQHTPAILMNELGNVSIDSDEVEEGVPLKELLGGCICCTIQEKLEAQLQELLFGEPFDSLLIETTGAAHPVEVIDSILSPLFADRFDMRGVVTVVDGTRFLERSTLSIQVQQLYLEQIRHGDLIVVNKSDQLTDSMQAELSQSLQAINSLSPILFTTYSKVPSKYIDQLTFDPKSKNTSLHVENTLRIQSMVYTFEGSVDLEEFESFLRELPDSIYRMKGYIPFTHSKNPYTFQYSYGMPLYFPNDLKMPTNLVIIGEELPKDDLRDKLNNMEKKALG